MAADRLRVLLLIDGLGAGGAERSVAELARGLHHRGHEVTVAYQHRRSGAGDELHVAGVPLVHLDARRWPGRLRQLRHLVRSTRPDLLHSSLLSSNLLGRVATWRTGTPCLTSFTSASYGPGAFLAARPVRRAVMRTADGWTARHLGARAHAVSGEVAAHMAEHLHLDLAGIAVVPRGRDRQRLGEPGPERRRAERARLEVADEEVVLLQLGRVDHVKGHLTLLEAWGTLAATRPGIRLLIVGRPGSASADVERALAEQSPDLARRVRLLGALDDVGGVLAAADVLALPSAVEGFPGVLLEAFAMEVAVVASDLPGVREALGPTSGSTATGLLVPAGDPDAWADAVGRLVDDPIRRRAVARAGRDRYEQRFTLEHQLDAMEALYRDVVGQ